MAKQHTVLYDGKSIAPWNTDDMTGWTVLSGSGNNDGMYGYFRTVPWLYRAVKDRSNNVGKMPFAILLNGKEFDGSRAYRNRIKCMPNPHELFMKLDMSLVMTGRAYAQMEINSSGYVTNLKYLVPTTISEVEDKDGQIIGYERTVKTRKLTIPADQMIAIYDPDYATEAGPGKSSAASAAMSSAGMLYNADEFISGFFKRGAIKATVLSTGGTSKNEAERLQSWWDNVVRGIKNAWTAFVLRGESVKVTVIGEGLESLQNESLTTERRQNIATAIGVPESRMWSSAANYATRLQDDKAYFESTIIQDCDLIAAAFNEKLFTADHKLAGYLLDFQYETLDIFQADAKEQALALRELRNSGVPLVIAMDLVGMDLTDEQREQLITLEKEMKEKPASAPAKVETPFEADMRRWQRKASKRLRNGQEAACEFDSERIPAALAGAIYGSLAGCETAEQIKTLFEQSLTWEGYP